MPNVVHLGPANSPGGISTVIENLVRNPPEGWNVDVIPTHSPKSAIGVIKTWISSIILLRRRIIRQNVDIVHVHVTHSLSWWRKLCLMKICDRYGIPTVIHIHSGRFDEFCSGFAGRSVKKNLLRSNRKVVVLEERWLKKLEDWIPGDSRIVHNFSEIKLDRSKHKIGGEINLLMLSRESRIKGHSFGVEILSELDKMGIDANLKFTGVSRYSHPLEKSGKIKALGWVSEEEKTSLMENADFLLMPSEFEGSSMTVIESIVGGLPPIVSSASSETIGIQSIALELENPKDWCNKILEYYEPQSYNDLVRQLESQSNRFSVEKSREKWEEIYGDLLELRQQ